MDIRNKIIGRLDSNIQIDENSLDELNQSHSDFEFVVLSKANLLYTQGKYKESLECYIEALNKYPTDLSLNYQYRNFLGQITKDLEIIGNADPSSFQFREVYEYLKELGSLSFKSHILAVEHYRMTDELNKAKEILEILAVLAPNYHGLLKLEDIV